jgi:nucleoside triphosphatase
MCAGQGRSIDRYGGEDAMSGEITTRVIVVGVVRNARGEYLICRMPEGRGVFPGQWGLPGGGIEPGESLEQALRREIKEEVGLDLLEVEPLFFSDGTYVKSFPDGGRRPLYMVFLLYRCLAGTGEMRLNPEFDEAAWVPADQLSRYALNAATVETLSRLGLLRGPGAMDREA